MTREEWDERYPNGHPQGFQPWGICTLGERIQIAIIHAVGWGIIVPTMVLFAVWLIGSIGEDIAQRSQEHDRCLKNANNGYEIKQCR